MPTFQVTLTRTARRDLRALPRNVLKRVDCRILALEKDPLPPGVEKLTGKKDLFRVRVGSCRILYRIERGELLVLVIRVRHRREVYRL